MGTPWAPSLVYRRGHATGPCRTPYYIRPLYQDRVIAAPPNTQKQTQGSCQNEETTMAQMKEQIKTPKKELNKREISTLSDAEFSKLFIRILKELSEDLSSIQKIQSETKDTLTEIKDNL